LYTHIFYIHILHRYFTFICYVHMRCFVYTCNVYILHMYFTYTLHVYIRCVVNIYIVHRSRHGDELYFPCTHFCLRVHGRYSLRVKWNIHICRCVCFRRGIEQEVPYTHIYLFGIHMYICLIHAYIFVWYHTHIYICLMYETHPLRVTTHIYLFDIRNTFSTSDNTYIFVWCTEHILYEW